MANVGVPPGGQYPSRTELGAQLRPYIETTPEMAANRGSERYEQLNAVYDNFSASYYDQQANDPQNLPVGATEAAVLSDVPTSSTDYGRPRTVAAGYDASRQTMTVVFRDGTFYNYYEVTPGEWSAFSSSFSKGKPWLNRGFKGGKQEFDGLFIGKPRGEADVSTIDPVVREQLYRVSRTQQLRQKPLQSTFNPGKVAGYQAKLGRNPSRGGTNPAVRKRKP